MVQYSYNIENTISIRELITMIQSLLEGCERVGTGDVGSAYDDTLADCVMTLRYAMGFLL